MCLASTITVWKSVEVFSCRWLGTKFTEVIICNDCKNLKSNFWTISMSVVFICIQSPIYFLKCRKKVQPDEKAEVFSLSFQDFSEIAHSGTLLIYWCTKTALSNLSNIFHYLVLSSFCPISLKVLWKCLKNVWIQYFVIWRNWYSCIAVALSNAGFAFLQRISYKTVLVIFISCYTYTK